VLVYLVLIIIIRFLFAYVVKAHHCRCGYTKYMNRSKTRFIIDKRA